MSLRSLCSLFRHREVAQTTDPADSHDPATSGAQSDLEGIYTRFSPFTMINEKKYVDTLRLLQDWGSREARRGAVVECGCWRGGMSAGMATVLGNVGVYHLFDSFEGLPPAREIDGARAQAWQQDPTGPRYHDNCRAERAEAEQAMKMTPIEWHIHPGWFEDTLPQSTVDDLCVLRLDGDWYDSTMLSLETFYPRLQEGGMLLIDDYYIWEGCCRAVHDYLSRIQSTSRIHSLNAVCYIIKSEERDANVHSS